MPAPPAANSSDEAIFARAALAMQPQPTGVAPQLATLSQVRAVVFDVYGTLLISGSGDVGTAAGGARDAAMRDALAAVGIAVPERLDQAVAALEEQIRRQHAAAAARGVEQPEVDIADVWRRWLLAAGHPRQAADPRSIQRLATEFEARANPTWPMPGARQTVAQLVRRGYRLGIVSNAQQFTLGLMRLHFGGDLPKLGFALDLSLLSNRFGHAKPGRALFDRLCRSLRRMGLRPEQAVYVGNDMLNDIWAAQRAGLRTALFAGDARSLRWRQSRPEVRGTRPDVVISELPQLLDCLDVDG